MRSSDACGSQATTTSGPSVRHGATRHSPLGTRHSHNLTDSRHHSPRDCSAAEHQKHRSYQLTALTRRFTRALLSRHAQRSTRNTPGEHVAAFVSPRFQWHANSLKGLCRAVDLNSMSNRRTTAALVRRTKSFEPP